MKRIWVFLFCLMVCVSIISAETYAITYEGKKVLLKNDNTWSYVESTSNVSSDLPSEPELYELAYSGSYSTCNLYLSNYEGVNMRHTLDVIFWAHKKLKRSTPLKEEMELLSKGIAYTYSLNSLVYLSDSGPDKYYSSWEHRNELSNIYFFYELAELYEHDKKDYKEALKLYEETKRLFDIGKEEKPIYGYNLNDWGEESIDELENKLNTKIFEVKQKI